MNEPGPDTLSGDAAAMQDYIAKVSDILAGQDAVRAAGEKYLPKFENESDEKYDYRRENGKFTNIFRDIVENLASKPFAKELTLGAAASQRVTELCEDIDAQGNHIHVFAADTFFNGIANAIDWIFVDHTRVPAGATLAEERSMGARPYWVHVPASRMVAAYSDIVDGVEQFIHVRWKEDVTERSGWEEVASERVRVLNRQRLESGGYGPATFELYEKQRNELTKKDEWVVIDEGDISIGQIALVPFFTGRRIQGSWRIQPPLLDALDLQINHYQQETNLERAKETSCFPMITANNIEPILDEEGRPVPVMTGPGIILYGGRGDDGKAGGSWGTLEPGASSLMFLAKEIERAELQLRELGRQPLTAQSSNLTVVTTMFAAQKGNSAVQAWALLLKDSLERALVYTCMWLNSAEEPEVVIHTDFGIDSENDTAPATLTSMRASRDLSQRTYWSELQRRNILSAEFNAEKEEEALKFEAPDPMDLESQISAFTQGRKAPPDRQAPKQLQ